MALRASQLEQATITGDGKEGAVVAGKSNFYDCSTPGTHRVTRARVPFLENPP